MSVSYPSKLVYRTEYEEHADLAFVVIDAVAIAAKSSHAEVGPLNDVLDPDALCELFDSRADGRGRSGGTVSFQFDGYRVTIDATTREVLVYE